MKIYRVNDGGTLQVADAPDGALPIGYGATVDADGREHCRITRIDYENRRYWRGGKASHVFPEHWCDPSELEWKNCSDHTSPQRRLR